MAWSAGGSLCHFPAALARRGWTGCRAARSPAWTAKVTATAKSWAGLASPSSIPIGLPHCERCAFWPGAMCDLAAHVPRTRTAPVVFARARSALQPAAAARTADRGSHAVRPAIRWMAFRERCKAACLRDPAHRERAAQRSTSPVLRSQPRPKMAWNWSARRVEADCPAKPADREVSAHPVYAAIKACALAAVPAMATAPWVRKAKWSCVGPWSPASAESLDL